jgi:hypothetical protein
VYCAQAQSLSDKFGETLVISRSNGELSSRLNINTTFVALGKVNISIFIHVGDITSVFLRECVYFKEI